MSFAEKRLQMLDNIHEQAKYKIDKLERGNVDEFESAKKVLMDFVLDENEIEDAEYKSLKEIMDSHWDNILAIVLKAHYELLEVIEEDYKENLAELDKD